MKGRKDFVGITQKKRSNYMNEELLKEKEELSENEEKEEEINDGNEKEEDGVEEEIEENEVAMNTVGNEEEAVQKEPVQESEKMLTQSQVNELVGKARQEGRLSAIREMIDRYGVGSEDELNDVFGRGQAYESLNDDYINTNRLYGDVMAENALLKSHVDMNRWDDIKLILGGKGLDITEENIEALLPSHPEWKGVVSEEKEVQAPVVTPSVLQKLGEDISPKESDEEDEEAKVRKWYGI